MNFIQMKAMLEVTYNFQLKLKIINNSFFHFFHLFLTSQVTRNEIYYKIHCGVAQNKVGIANITIKSK